MDFFELVKISTIGPEHLRLNEDILRLIKEHMKVSKVLLSCRVCGCALLKEMHGVLEMEITYFSDMQTNTHVCYNCSRFNGMEKFMSADDANRMM